MSNTVPSLTLRLEKGTPLTPAEMDNNFKIIRDFCNGLASLLATSLNPNGTLKDGAVGSADVIADGIITAVKMAADSIYYKAGDIKISASGTTSYSTADDQGWLECDGSNVSRTVFANLFAAIGTTFGPGDGSTTFTLPDFRRRVPVGRGGTPFPTGDVANTIGSAGGEEAHELTVGELPNHTHQCYKTKYVYDAGGANNGVAFNNFYGLGTQDDALPLSGGNVGITDPQAHNNMQPSLVVRYLIKT